MTRRIRDMTLADIEQVAVIEARTFTLPWSHAVFASVATKAESICLVCVEDDHVVGYLIADTFVDVWHLMNVAVEEDRRGERIASDLIETYFEITEAQPHRGHTLEVRISNESAIELYRSFGFVATGVRRSYYSDNREDALIMWKDWEGRSA